jgi:hypothetical protein
MNTFTPQVSHFDAWQGRNEQHSEAYIQYAERAAQFLTQPGAKSGGGVACSAGKQAGAVREL